MASPSVKALPGEPVRAEAALPRAARTAVTVIFFACGVGLSSWVPRIPAVQDRLGLSEGVLGAALLCMAAGAMLAMPAAGWLIGRIGSRRVTTLTALAFSLAVPLPVLAPNLLGLAAGLLVLGAATGALDVSMNAHGVAVERRYGRPILASFHAAFSFGGLGGAAVGGVAAETGVRPGAHLGVVAIVLIGAMWAASRRLMPTAGAGAGAGGDGPGPAFVRPTGRLAVVGAIAFCALLGEGSVADWSAIYLSDHLAAGAGVAAAGFAAFSLTMAFGRLVGDWVTARWGPVAVTRTGGALAAIGLGLGLALDHPLAAVVGFAAIGAGLANIVPVAFSAAGRVPGVPAATGIAAVSTAGYAGLLAGPPLIGLTAELVGLPLALALVVLLSAAIALLADSLGR